MMEYILLAIIGLSALSFFLICWMLGEINAQIKAIDVFEATPAKNPRDSEEAD